MISKRFKALSRLGLLPLLIISCQAPARAAPIIIEASAKHVTDGVVYQYRVVNNSAKKIAAIWIGYDIASKDGANHGYELNEIPLGWSFETGIPVGSATAPPHWTVSLITPEETPTHALKWEMEEGSGAELFPGGTLSDMSVTVASRDQINLSGHAKVIFADGGVPKYSPVTITSKDVTPPTLSLSVNNPVLWPPKGKPVNIAASITVKDDFDPAPELKLESITANEKLVTTDISGANFGTDDRQFSLVAKRAGTSKTGRIYTITYSATDASGNKATASATVTVPHDQGE